MATVIDELVTILGFDMDSQAASTLRKFTQGIESVTDYAEKASIAIVGIATSVGFFVTRANDASDEVEKLGRVTGISTDTIQEMAFAMEQVGGNASTMNSDLEGLLLSMNSPIPGEFNQGLFLLGISTRNASGGLKEVDDVLLDIADKMQGMSEQRALQWGKKIGISKDTVMLLQEGREEIERLRKQAKDLPTIIDPQSLKDAREFNRQISLLSRIFAFLGQTAAASAGPAIKGIVDSIVEWTSANKDLIKSNLQAFVEGIVQGFVKFGEVAGKISDRIIGFISQFSGLSDSLSKTEIIMTVVYSALIALSIPLAILAAKFLAITAIITAVGLAIEDFTVYLEGGSSMTGDFVKSIKELGQAFATEFPAMADFLQQFWDVLKPFVNFLVNVVIGNLKMFGDLLKKSAEGWGMIFGLAEEGLKKLGFGDQEATVTLIEEKVEKVAKAVQEPMRQVEEAVQEPMRQVEEQVEMLSDSQTVRTVAQMSGPPVAPVAQAGPTDNSQTNQNVTNNIDITVTGDNAPAVANRVGGKLSTILNQTYPGGLAPAVQ